MDDYGKALPFTGGGVALFGVFIDQMWLAIIATGLVVVGAVAIRVGFRRGKKASQA